MYTCLRYSTYTGAAAFLGNAGDTADKSGSAYWAGVRYDLSKIGAYGKFGYEYNHGSKNWFSFTQGSNDITNKLATRGSAHEVYYIAPINRYAYIRFGVQDIHYDYTGSGSPLGAPVDTKSAAAQGMGANALKELQNLYFQFNVQY